MRFFDPLAPVEETKNRLPHWEQPEATYSVTFRTEDSIPQSRLRGWAAERAAWLAAHPEPWSRSEEKAFHLRFSSRMQRWLDLCEGKCLLRVPENAALVGEALMHFDQTRCVQHAWVVMPNHVHALFSLVEGDSLSELLRSWKSFTARRIQGHEQGTAFWARDFFNRLVRDEGHFWNCARYCRRNPAKARLVEGEYLMWESEDVRQGLDGEDGA